MPECFEPLNQEDRPCPDSTFRMDLNNKTEWSYISATNRTLKSSELVVDGTPEFDNHSLILRNTDVTISRPEIKGGNVGGITVMLSWAALDMLDMELGKQYVIAELPLCSIVVIRDGEYLTPIIRLDEVRNITLD